MEPRSQDTNDTEHTGETQVNLPERWEVALAFAIKVKDEMWREEIDPGSFFRLVVELIDRIQGDESSE